MNDHWFKIADGEKIDGRSILDVDAVAKALYDEASVHFSMNAVPDGIVARATVMLQVTGDAIRAMRELCREMAAIEQVENQGAEKTDPDAAIDVSSFPNDADLIARSSHRPTSR